MTAIERVQKRLFEEYDKSLEFCKFTIDSMPLALDKYVELAQQEILILSSRVSRLDKLSIM